MNKNYLYLLFSMLFFKNTYAVTDEQYNTLLEKINQMNQRTYFLEQKVTALTHKVNALKKQKASHPNHAASSQQSVSAQSNEKKQGPLNLPFQMRPVVIAPYYGIDAAAVVVTPTYNQDIKMLQQRQILEKQYQDSHLLPPPTPLVELSGRLEGQFQADPHMNQIELTGAELDFASQFNPWVVGFAAFIYDNTPISSYRIKNSRIYLDRGFITIGNLNQTPFYGTLGQRYVPFGQYNTFMVQGPLTSIIARTNARSLLMGYQHPGDAGMYFNAYVFKGDSHRFGAHNGINNGGFSFGYEQLSQQKQLDFGVDAIRNIADSVGMQLGVASGSSIFAQSDQTENLYHLVPGLALHTKIGLKPWTFLAEYIRSLHAFDPNDIRYNNRGAQPGAYNLELGYNFDLWEKPSSLALGYGHTQDALFLMVPKQTLAITLNSTIWENTLASIEIRHDIQYSKNDTAAVKQQLINAPSQTHSNSIIARLAVYF